jgi:Fe(3+) dicitrate transport protein
VLTRPAPTAGPAGAADVAAGLYGTYKAHAWAGTGGDRGGIVAEGVHLRSDGFKHIDGGGETGFNRSEFMLKGALTPGTHELGLKLGYANETSHETYMGLTLEDYQEDPYRRYAASALGLMHWDRTMAELSWLARPGRHLQVRTVAYHRWFSRAWTKFNSFAGGPDMHDLLQQDPGGQSAVYTAILRGEEDSTTEDQVLLIGTNDRRFQNVGLQSTARWSAYGDRASSTLEGGVRLHFDDVHRLHTEDPYDMLGGELVRRDEPTQTTTDSQAQALALAAHLHEDLNFGDWNVLPGVRMEVVRTSLVDAGEEADAPELRATPLPGLGLLYRAGSWVDLFAGAHRGFSPVAPGQPEEVLPELSWNYEAGGRFAQGERHVEVVGFFNDYQNISGQCTLSGGCDPDDVGTQYNGGAVWIYGAEAVAGDVFLLPGGLSLSLSATYAFTRSRFRTGFTSGFTQFGTVEIGDSLPYVPEHQGGAELAVLHPRVELGVGLSARSGMLDEAGTFPVSELDVPALALLDASLRVNLTDRVALYGTGTNLTGSTAITSWRPSGARPTAPLMAMGGVKVDGGR